MFPLRPLRHLRIVFLCIPFLALPCGAGEARHVNAQRLRQALEDLSQFGRNPEGGVSRVAFSEADRAGREYVMRLMREAGLAVRVDPAGNIYGRREGSEKLPVLLFGSHIDSVPKGGNFDGDVGSLGAIEVIRTLSEQKITTRHPLEVVVWTNEEGPLRKAAVRQPRRGGFTGRRGTRAPRRRKRGTG